MEKKSRRKFSAEFKQEAVALASQPEQSIAAVAANLGIGPGLLQRWKRELSEHGGKAFVGQGVARDDEMLELRRELAQVKKERDFLKSAARGRPSATSRRKANEVCLYQLAMRSFPGQNDVPTTARKTLWLLRLVSTWPEST